MSTVQMCITEHDRARPAAPSFTAHQRSLPFLRTSSGWLVRATVLPSSVTSSASTWAMPPRQLAEEGGSCRSTHTSTRCPGGRNLRRGSMGWGVP
jgi:hypothetical protein